MRNFREKIVVVFLVAVLVLPLYAWMINVVNALQGHDLIESFELRSDRKSVVTSVFDIGDTLIVVASSGIADNYELGIYCGSSSVFVRSGAFIGGSAQIPVPLDPSSFIAGRSYLVVFVAYASDYPIPGALASDTISSSYAIVAVDAEIDLGVEYDVSSSSLVLNASLATVDGFPVSNEGVDFALQFDKQRRTEGWVPLASVKTRSDGSARMNLAFGLSSGNYRVRAVHKGNENYGKSEVVDRVTVVSNITDGTSNSTASSSGASFPDDPSGSLSLSVNSLTPYALLPMKATSTYIANVALQGSVWILFFLDHTKSSRFLSSAKVEHNGTVPYVYETSLLWSSGVLGSHKIISGVVNGSAAELEAAIKNGAGLIASDEVDIDIQRCPSNVVVDFPDALHGDVLPVTVAVSKPRPYEAEVNGFYVTTALAPHLFYDGVEYVVDEGVGSAPLRLYVDGNLTFENSTDSCGLVNFRLSMSLNNSRVRAAVEGSALLSDVAVEEDLFFRRISVFDVAHCWNSPFKIDFALSNGAEEGKLYIAVDSRLKAESSFLNQPVWNLPVSMIYGKLVSTAQTDGLGRASVPVGSDYLRVSSLGTGGSGGERDVNLENTNPWDSYVVFDSGQTEYLDSQRFARIPVGATNLTFCYDYWSAGATIEFFKIVAEEDARTDGLGKVDATWVPNELGKYVAQVKLPSQFDLITSVETSMSVMQASTNLFEYFDVVKRPVYLSLSHSLRSGGVGGGDRDINLEGTDDVAVDECVDFILSAVDGATSGPGSGMPIECFVNNASLGTVFTNSSGVAVFSWTPASNIVYNVVTSYCGNGIYEASNASLTFDLRDPTDLRLWLMEKNASGTYYPVQEIADNGTINVGTFVDYPFRVEDLPESSGGESVKVYVDGSLYTTAQISPNVHDAVFTWMNESAGVHYINVSYGGNQNYKPDDLCFAAKAKASPVSLEFSVNDTSFAPGDLVTLRARAINPLTGQPLSGLNIGFWQDGYGSGVRVGDYVPTDTYGVATTTWTYPSVGGAHTIIAKVKDGQAVANVTLAIQPIILNVGVETRLWLWVERGLTNTDHTVYARLVRADDPDCAVSNQTLKLDVGGTVYTLTTNRTGYANQSLSLVAVSGQTTTYQIRAVFEGAGFKTRNLTIPDPYGRDYAVCTTMQWDFKSSQNSVTLAVEAPKTDVTTSEPASPSDNVTVTQTPETTTVTVPPPKTPEQMQQEANQTGWLTTWHEFSWWYPWYRLHLKFYVNGAEIDVGYNPVLQGEETSQVENVGNIIVPIIPLPTIPLEELQRIVQEMLEASIVDVLGLAAFVLAAGNTRVPLIIYPALIGYGLALFALGYHATQNLYNVGSENAGRAFMAGVFIGLVSVLLTTILGLAALSGTTIITTNVIFAVIGTLVGSSYDSKPAMDFTRALIIGLLGAIAVSAVGLRLLPFEPMGNTFYFAFLMTTLTAMFMAKIVLDGMR